MSKRKPANIHLTAPDLCERKLRAQGDEGRTIPWREVVDLGLQAIEKRNKRKEKIA